MKSIFTKLGKLLLCGVAVAVVGCTDYDTDIQNVNERVDAVEADFEKAIADLQAEINAKFATKAELAALEETLNTTIDAEVAKLNAAIDKKADKAEVEAAIADLQKALADAKAELDAADAANKAAIDGAVARIVALEDAAKALQEAVSMNTMGIQNLTTALEVFQAEVDAQMDALYAYIDKMDQEIYSEIAVLSGAITSLTNQIADLQLEDQYIYAEITKLQESISAVNALLNDEAEKRKSEDAELQRHLNEVADNVATLYTLLNEESAARKYEDQVLAAEIRTLEGTISAVNALLNETNATLAAHIAAYETFEKSMQEAIANLTMVTTNHEVAIETLRNELEGVEGILEELKEEDMNLAKSILDLQEAVTGMVNATYDELMGYIEALNGKIEDTQKTLTMLNNLVQDVFNRVQSIVYVPEYDDHKGTLAYSVIGAQSEQPIVIPGVSVLTYKVNAEDASKVAATIAFSYEKYLDMEVKEVQVRSASDAPVADLEIVDVVAEDEYLLVSVLPKNFKDEFFTVDNNNIYSTSLLFFDGNNDYASVFTNLTRESAPTVIDVVVAKPSTETPNEWVVLDETEVIEHIYTDVVTVDVALDDYQPVFVVDGKYYTEEALKAEFGYDIKVTINNTIDYYDETGAQLTEGPGHTEWVGVLGYYPMLTLSDDIEEFHLTNANAEVNVNLTAALEADEIDNYLGIEYKYLVNGQEAATAESHIVITRQPLKIAFDDVTIPWTLELADALRAEDGTAYANGYTYEAAEHDSNYDVAKILQGLKESYSKVVTFNGEAVSSSAVQVNNYVNAVGETRGCADVIMAAGTMQFSAKQANVYEVVWTGVYNNQYDVTATLKVTLEQIPAYTVNSEVTLACVNPNWFAGKDALVADAVAAPFALGYEENVNTALYNALVDEATTSETSVSFGEATTTKKAGNGNVQFNVVEDEDLTDVYLFTSQINDLLGDARLKDGDVFVIKHTVNTWCGAEVVYNITVTADLPDYVLDVDPVRVNANDEVQVLGELEEVEGSEYPVYTVNLSDLAKYYYVYDADKKSLTATDNVALEVRFTLEGQDGKDGFTIDQDVLNVPFEDNARGLLPLDQAIVGWGTYPYTEIGVTATLYANGFPIYDYPITLITEDPLVINFDNVDVPVAHNAGDVDVVGKIYEKFNLTSKVQPNLGNLVDTKAESMLDVFNKSHADVTYGVVLDVDVVRVYYVGADGKDYNWDPGKYVIDEEAGTITIKADDGKLTTPIFAEVGVTMDHKIHEASETCRTTGTILVTFTPAE